MKYTALLIRTLHICKRSRIFITRVENNSKMSDTNSFENDTRRFSLHDIDQNKQDKTDCCNSNSFDHTSQTELYIINHLKKVLELKDTNVSSWVIETQMKTLCHAYKELIPSEQKQFFNILSTEYGVNHNSVCKAASIILKSDECTRQIIKYEEKLRNVLMPQYQWLLIHIGKLENGIKFLIDMRTNLLDAMKEMDGTDDSLISMQQLNSSLRDLLSLWFSVGFLSIERITWKSSCEMLQKISEYEAVHPVRSWTDLKQRVGPYRRCFVYTHSTMPGEPLVVLHTALSDEISTSVAAIVSNARRLSLTSDQSYVQCDLVNIQEDPEKIKAAIFYSIASTQRGLQGIELGNYLIKQVVKEVLSEYPHINKFSSLSPIPNFKNWFFDKLKISEKNKSEFQLFTKEEIESLKTILETDNICFGLKKWLNGSEWLENPKLVETLQVPLLRICAQYLYIEKRRGYALDNVANFHLRNGAVLWRINWLADLTPRGLTNSCGLMVNYRYFLENTVKNSIAYIEQKQVSISPLIKKILH